MSPTSSRITFLLVAALQEIALLAASESIDQGAQRQEPTMTVATEAHWSYQPLKRTAVPETRDGPVAIRNPIDAFISAKLATRGMALSAEADRRTFIRRVNFDMVGLPPTPEEIEAFTADRDPQAFEKLVDRLLASPRYGERWARHWLDVVRFAESHGFELNQARNYAWPYRDYVIHAFNADKPYDQFVREQLAGDALGVDEATGFLVAGPYDEVKSPDPVLTAQQRADELDDIVSTTGSAFLGLTVGCARCHNHKFDAISQVDYSAVTAVFQGVKHGERSMRPHNFEERSRQAAALVDELKAIDAQLADINSLPTSEVSATQLSEVSKLVAQRAEIERKVKALSRVANAYLGQFVQPEPTYRLRRGDPLQPREEVAPNGLASFAGKLDLAPNAPEQQRRLALARWITDSKNPLTARVMVNRIWHHHFGVGIVETPSDLGVNGARPSHPELLDWLASEFIAHGWKIKELHRLILLSSTYRQSSHANPAGLKTDAGSRLLWRFPPRRLEAEPLRDTMLAVSGQLNLRMGGPGFDLFEPNDNYAKVYTPKKDFGPAEFRRMIYQAKPRVQLDEVFGAFDCPDGGQITPRRTSSITPLQALNLLNSPFVVQQSAFFAERLKKEAGPDAAAQITRAFLLAFGRGPLPREINASRTLIREHGLTVFCRALFNANEFVNVL